MQVSAGFTPELYDGFFWLLGRKEFRSSRKFKVKGMGEIREEIEDPREVRSSTTGEAENYPRPL